MKEKRNEIKKGSRDIQTAESWEDQIILSPKTDIFENNDEIIIISEMPGVDEKDIDVSFEENAISLSGTIDSKIIPAGYEELREEFVSGRYERSFSILSDIKVDKISAKIKDGVLKVTLPKAEKIKPRKIEIKVEG